MDAEISDKDADAAPGEEGSVVILQDFFANVHAGLYIGVIDGTTLAANAHLKRIFAFSLDVPDHDVKPFDVARFADPKDHAAFLMQLRRDGQVDDYALRLRRDDATWAWLEVSATTDIRAVPEPVTYAIVRDVSNRRRDDDRSRDLHHQLQQAEKMAALGQTISGVAHELNNPLATILSWAERLAERPGDERTRRGLDVIRSESERAARIVRNLLTFARKRQTTRLLVNVNDVIRETIALRAYEQRASSSPIRESLAPTLPRVFADAHQIKQVILNLVINAEQAMQSVDATGPVTIRTWHDVENDGVVIEVKDEGPGISEERQARIFDPFYTTKEVGKGTGLGLSVAYAIVQEHGGRIWVVSAPGSGASFFVALPVAPVYRTTPGALTTPATVGAAAAPTALDTPEIFKGKKVLLVEDEPALALAVSEALGDAGFVVDRAADGEEALTRVAHNTYQLVVCDLKMPKLDGMQFYRAMAAAAPGLARRVIFVTGAVTGTDAERFLEETACRWLAKPFRLGDLLRAARETLS